jgi:hypothetical protein
MVEDTQYIWDAVESLHMPAPDGEVGEVTVRFEVKGNEWEPVMVSYNPHDSEHRMAAWIDDLKKLNA